MVKKQIDYSELKFSLKDGKFYHNLGGDYGIFAIWKEAKDFLDKIRELLEKNFEILLETRVIWSEENFHDNAARLYENPLWREIQKKDRFSGHAKKIGAVDFFVFIIKDNKPSYSIVPSVSKKIEITNVNIVNAKYKIRDWVLKEKGIKFGVHSSNNIYEFFYQSVLILGCDILESILQGEKLNKKEIKKDLEGANGWSNYTELFRVLNFASNYLVQRSFETLPEINEEKDIDFLTDNYQRLASALGVLQVKKYPYKGYIYVNGEKINVDLRFVGDKYYNVNWQKDMLDRKEKRGEVYSPRIDDYFFSLLYHAKLQKPEVKLKYVSVFEELSEKLNFDWFNIKKLENDEEIGLILKGFYQGYNYFFEDPIDTGVFKNLSIANMLPSLLLNNHQISMGQRIKNMLRKYVPKGIVSFVKTVIPSYIYISIKKKLK